MFLTEQIATVAHNSVKLRANVETKGVIPLEGKLEETILNRIDPDHIDDLRVIKNLLGVSQSENTYALGLSKGAVTCYAPRMVLRQRTLMLRWGSKTYIPVKDIVANEGIEVSPNVLTEPKFTKYSITLSTVDGYELTFRVWLREEAKLNTAQMKQMLKTGEGWDKVLNPERPKPLDEMVSLSNDTFEFMAVGYRTYNVSGTSKAGQAYSIDKQVIADENGNEYEYGVNKSRTSQDMMYWGTQMSADNPVKVSVLLVGVKEKQNGVKYNDISVNYTPTVSSFDEELDELLNMEDDYSSVDEVNTSEDVYDDL